MEWEAPAIVLQARPYGEGDAVATVLTEAHGAHRGLARGGSSRAHSAIWQPGNLVQVRWVARLADQLGSFSAELVHATAALAMDDSLALAVLAATCAVAEGALPEQEPLPRLFAGTLELLAQLAEAPAAAYVRWEMLLLRELGWGLDMRACAVTGTAEKLAWISPRTGRAVADEAAGVWKSRLLPLPPFLISGADGDPAQWRDGLTLAGHFLARDAFGSRHRPLPIARALLCDRVDALALGEPGHAG